jgi:hypothetical protein
MGGRPSELGKNVFELSRKCCTFPPARNFPNGTVRLNQRHREVASHLRLYNLILFALVFVAVIHDMSTFVRVSCRKAGGYRRRVGVAAAAGTANACRTKSCLPSARSYNSMAWTNSASSNEGLVDNMYSSWRVEFSFPFMPALFSKVEL